MPPPSTSPAGLQPVFAAPNVVALMSLRTGGVSATPYDSLNLGLHVGDAAQAVAENRRRFAQALDLAPVRLVQVHGREVLRLGPELLTQPAREADASVSSVPGLACEIQVADCLPVLFAQRTGRAVGAAHAGWRGLAAGVLEATVRALCEEAACEPGEIEAWLGPCIGPTRFEVGADVLRAFDVAGGGPGAFFVPTETAGKWWADLAGLARARLARLGLSCLVGNDGSARWCTASQDSDFFSFRRDGRTGRMAAAIGLRRQV